MSRIDTLREEARKLLKAGKVKYIIGYEGGADGLTASPVFIKDPDEAEKLIWDPGCVHNLAKFLVDEKRRKARQKQPDTRPVGIIVKGCDSRAVVVLLQEKFISREDVVLLGVSCEKTGVADAKKLAKKLGKKKPLKVEFGDKDNIIVETAAGKVEIPAAEVLAERCLECKANVPVIADLIIGDKTTRTVEKPFRSIEELESLSVEERWTFWKKQLGRCIRCYACRSVCPLCYCDECVVDSIAFAVTADTTAEEKAQKIKWLERSPVSSENIFYHLVRAVHLAGRCIDCAECERACPLDIPIRFLNKKLEKDAKELFGYEPGFDQDAPSLFSSFNDQDPGAFIR